MAVFRGGAVNVWFSRSFIAASSSIRSSILGFNFQRDLLSA